MSCVTLDCLHRGDRAVVHKLECADSELRNKLLSMGIVEGVSLEVSHSAPLGDPMTVRLMGFSLSLRLSEARHVRVMSV